VNTNTIISSDNHPKSIISSLKNSSGLPFSEVLSTETVNKSLKDIEYRERFFSPDMTLWTFLSQVLDDDQSQQAAVARVIAFCASQGREPPSINTSAYSQARSRLPEELISNLTQEAAKEIENQAPSHWLWSEKNLKVMDGSTVSMPDTPENQAVYPQPDSQKRGVGFPIARIVAILSYVTGVVLELAIGSYSGKGTGEHSLLRQLMHAFKAGDVALGDCYYASFFLLSMLMQLGVDAVFPIHSARNHDFRVGKRLGKKDHIVQWKKPPKPEWMELEEYDKFPEEIMIREVSIQSCRNGFRTKTRVLVTTFLDPIGVNKADLAALYSCRWFVELALRSIKETMRMDVLRGKTPEMVRKEIWTHLLAYNLIRKVMAQAAILYNKIPRELSFKLALQIIEAFRQAGIFNEKNDDAYAELLKAVAYKTVGNRPGRHEPRRVKRRPKAFPRLQKARKFYKRAA
jgi:Transposase DDE domain